MRFLSDGPSIPDELLTARYEGRVVFFCGAGISMARAKLPSFFGLADKVIDKLGVPTGHPIFKILNLARSVESGLISVDRVFGLLERQFLSRDIHRAVAKALQPAPEADLTAHRILLHLATSSEGKIRLVTTNFDRLFEECDPNLKIRLPGSLPDASRPDDMDGIVHLHGVANSDYSGAEGDGFILSSSEFGWAYLSEGWATQFFREIVTRYVVVFVGYAADDPPVQYLLEALRRKSDRLADMYAFHGGSSMDAPTRWLHKGVQAIAYPPSEGHSALWETLEAWAERAKVPDEWLRKVVELAKGGPELLQPYQRGQVAHVVSTVKGVREFRDAEPPPPAEWLCVFDRLRRYARPGPTGDILEPGPYIDPFDLYGLDSDTPPTKVDPDNPHETRDVPETAWDGLTANRLDREDLRKSDFVAVRGAGSAKASGLPRRLAEIAAWIARIADQPTSVWWAAYQSGLHPEIQFSILWELRRSTNDASSAVRRAWQYLFESWEEKQEDFQFCPYDLHAMITRDGWSSPVVRKFVQSNRPILKAKENRRCRPKPPEWKDKIRLEDMLDLKVEYPPPQFDLKIPDEWLKPVVKGLRQNLERALDLETEIGGYELSKIAPIIPEGPPHSDLFGRTSGLSGSVLAFSEYFQRLIRHDFEAATRELAVWPTDDDTIFGRLRMWASGIPELVPEETCRSIIASLSNKCFWHSSHQRDLLLVLAKRWGDLSSSARREIERRLLDGPAKWKDEGESEFQERKARSSLDRLTWLITAANSLPG